MRKIIIQIVCFFGLGEIFFNRKFSFHKTKKNNKTKIMVNLGDSIFDSRESSISKYISELTGITTFNAGFGGTRMSAHIDYWNSFSMYRLADSIANNDFTLQKKVVSSFNDFLPWQFKYRLKKLIKINFKEVDFITISHGTNDYTAEKLLDDPQDAFNIDTYAGALRYSIAKITEAYPHIQIIICSPAYRYWELDGKYIDSDERFFNKDSNVLPDFVNMAKTIACEYNIPFIDLYHEAGINRHNASNFFAHSDGTHHIEPGRFKIAETISKRLNEYVKVENEICD